MNRLIVRAILAFALLGTSVVGITASANAAGGEQGVLLLKGPGSVYGQPGSVSSLSVNAGTAASFSFEVKNLGPTVAQFNISLPGGTGSCAVFCATTTTVTAGSLDITGLATGPNGYYTAPIAAGGVATYTLKITPQKSNSTPGDVYTQPIRLADTAGTQLGLQSQALVNVTRGTGGGGADQFVSSTGTSPTSGNAVSGYGVATAPSVAVGKTFAFTVKLQNNGTTPTAMSYQLRLLRPCGGYFPVKVVQGSALSGTNVTSAVLGGSYQTATLAHGASVSLTVTGTSLAGGAACLAARHAGSDAWEGDSQDPAGESATNFLVFSPAY
jgi:hypothetical protein